MACAPVSRGHGRLFWEAVGRNGDPAVLLRSKAGGSPAGGQYLSGQGPDYEICKYQKSILGFCLAYARKSLRRCLLRTHRQVGLREATDGVILMKPYLSLPSVSFHSGIMFYYI